MAAAALTIAGVFGSKKDVGEIVKSFDWSKVKVEDKSTKSSLTFDIAPSFGKLTSESIKSVDEQLKVMIAGTIKLLSQEKSKGNGDLSWDSVMSIMMQNPLIEPDKDAIHRTDKLVKAGTNVFKFDGSPEAGIVREVQTWFTDLVHDEDVLRSTKIDIGVLAKIVAQTGATIDSFETVFFKDESHEKTLIDIGVLRFPDIDHPYFKVYKIKLVAWSHSKRILMVQDDSNGITGEFFSRIFRPRRSVLDKMTASSIAKAVEQADHLFD